MKKAYFFTLDMLIAIVVLISAISAIHFYSESKQKAAQETYYASDLLDILSSVKISDLNDTELVKIINATNQTNKNLTILEFVGRLYLKNEKKPAEWLLGNLTDDLISENIGLGVWIEGVNESKVIFSNDVEAGNTLITSKQMITGIEETKPIEGFNSRIFLTGITKQLSSFYAYFGGYIGDGNITKKIILPSSFDSITKTYVELNAGSDFNLYINGIFSGRYNITEGGLIADNWTIDSSYLTNFQGGDNEIEIVFLENDQSYIGGGYIGVHYQTSSLETYDFSQQKDYLSGIEGIINIYDSFYIPGNLNNMSIYLNYSSDYKLYLTIANKTVIYSAPIGDHAIYLDDSNLTKKLDYSSLNKKTTPFRLGILTSPTGPGETNAADIVLVTDLSDSMFYKLGSEELGIERNCTDPELFNSTTQRISLAKCLDKQFIDTILVNPANRIALAGFYGDTANPYKGLITVVEFSNDPDHLKQQIDSYTPQGSTPVCAPLNYVDELFEEQSSVLRQKFVVIMSDGIPTHTCGSGPTDCDGERNGISPKEALWLGQSTCAFGGLDKCETNDCECAAQNANWSSCQLREKHNATVYSIGYGPVSSCFMANKTLRDIAECGGGEYFVSDNASQLQLIYANITDQILSFGYEGQTAVDIEGLTTTYLYPDSYIAFNYTPEVPLEQYGRIPVTIESPRFNNNISQGNFSIPSEVTVYDAKITSYSAEKWTDVASIDNSAYSWFTFYNLSKLANYYYFLGDPYIVNIPVEYIQTGLNKLRIKTGIDPENASGGSSQNRVIYTVGVDLTVNASGVFEKAQGCIWFLEYEDETSGSLTAPETYTGTETCYYNSTTDCDADYETDAINNAVCKLFMQMDFDNDGLLFVKVGSDDLSIESNLIANIPYMWGPTLMEVRVWQ